MKALIQYFTGTGNSKGIAEICRIELTKMQYKVDICDISCLKSNETARDITLVGFIYPVIGLAAPRIILKQLKKLSNNNHQINIFLIATKGSDHNQGWALEEPLKIITKKGLKVIGTKSIHMPDNWITVHKPGPKSNNKELIKKAGISAVDFIKKAIKNKNEIEKFQWPAFGIIGSIIIKYIFRFIGIKRLWTHFKTTSSCSGCAKCVRICPTQSIKMHNNRPKWFYTCEQCMRCVSYCPQKAIIQFEFLFHGSKNIRYKHPDFNPEEG